MFEKNIYEKAVRVLANADSSEVTEVCLTECDRAEIELILERIQKFPFDIKEIILSFTLLSDLCAKEGRLFEQDLLSLIKPFQENKNLSHIEIAANETSYPSQYATPIVIKLLNANIPCIKSIFFQGEFTKENIKEVDEFKQALEKNVTVTQLRITSGSSIDIDGAKLLSQALITNQSLTNLDLSMCIIGDEGAEQFAKALEQNNTLKYLRLPKNQIGVRGAISLAQALKVNHTLQALDLSRNDIRDGVNKIAEMLAQNKVLTDLNLSANHIGSQVTSILSALQTNSHINKLCLKDESISGADAGALSSVLKANKLIDLRLGINGINGECGANIASGLSNNTSLQRLDLFFDETTDDEGLTNILNALSNHPSIRVIKLVPSFPLRHYFEEIKIKQAVASLINESESLENLTLGNNIIVSAPSLAEALLQNTRLTQLKICVGHLDEETADK